MLQNVEIRTKRLLDLYLDGGLEKALYEEKMDSLRAEELDDLTPEERHQIYRMLGLSRVRLDNTEAAEIRGVVSVPEEREHINSGCR